MEGSLVFGEGEGEGLRVLAEELEQPSGEDEFVGRHLAAVDPVLHGLDEAGERLAVVAGPEGGEVGLAALLEGALEGERQLVEPLVSQRFISFDEALNFMFF